jgi:hypothetical protein
MQSVKRATALPLRYNPYMNVFSIFKMRSILKIGNGKKEIKREYLSIHSIALMKIILSLSSYLFSDVNKKTVLVHIKLQKRTKLYIVFTLEKRYEQNSNRSIHSTITRL